MTTDTTNHKAHRIALDTEYHAWLALVSEMRKAGVGDINKGGKHERLHDAITAWGEELAQLRMNDPDPARAERALQQRRNKYLGPGGPDQYYSHKP